MMFRKYVDVVGLAQPDPRHYAPFPNNPIMVDENAIKKLTEQPPENIPLIWEHKPDIVLGTVREWYTDPKDQDSLLVFARMDLDTDLGSIIYHEAMNGKRYGFSPGYAYKPVPELGIVLRTRIKDISITADPHYTNSVMEILGSKWTKQVENQGKFLPAPLQEVFATASRRIMSETQKPTETQKETPVDTQVKETPAKETQQKRDYDVDEEELAEYRRQKAAEESLAIDREQENLKPILEKASQDPNFRKSPHYVLLSSNKDSLLKNRAMRKDFFHACNLVKASREVEALAHANPNNPDAMAQKLTTGKVKRGASEITPLPQTETAGYWSSRAEMWEKEQE